MKLKITGILKDNSSVGALLKYLGCVNNAPFGVKNYMCMHHCVVGDPTFDGNSMSVSITLAPCEIAAYEHVDFSKMFDLMDILFVHEIKEQQDE